MSLRNACVVLAGLVWLFLSVAARPQPLAADKEKGDDVVDLTILYTGDEVGYLEPCG